MAQKKHLGKDPFSSAAPVPEPEVAADPTKEAEVKATRTRKPRTNKATSVTPVATASPIEKAAAEGKVSNENRDAEIDNIKRELAELQALVLRLQHQMDVLKPWNDHFLSAWQWWFSLFSDR